MDRSKLDIENIKKDQIFKVPENYFDELPMKIQSRIAEEKKPRFVFEMKKQFAWSFAAAMIILGFGVVFYLSQPVTRSTEELLADVSTEDMIAYLESSEVTVFDILEEIDVADLLDGDVDYWDYLDENLSIDEIDQLYEEMDISLDYLIDENSI